MVNHITVELTMSIDQHTWSYQYILFQPKLITKLPAVDYPNTTFSMESIVIESQQQQNSLELFYPDSSYKKQIQSQKFAVLYNNKRIQLCQIIYNIDCLQICQYDNLQLVNATISNATNLPAEINKAVSFSFFVQEVKVNLKLLSEASPVIQEIGNSKQFMHYDGVPGPYLLMPTLHFKTNEIIIKHPYLIDKELKTKIFIQNKSLLPNDNFCVLGNIQLDKIWHDNLYQNKPNFFKKIYKMFKQTSIQDNSKYVIKSKIILNKDDWKSDNKQQFIYYQSQVLMCYNQQIEGPIILSNIFQDFPNLRLQSNFENISSPLQIVVQLYKYTKGKQLLFIGSCGVDIPIIPGTHNIITELECPMLSRQDYEKSEYNYSIMQDIGEYNQTGKYNMKNDNQRIKVQLAIQIMHQLQSQQQKMVNNLQAGMNKLQEVQQQGKIKDLIVKKNNEQK